jgi:hypothetical protein
MYLISNVFLGKFQFLTWMYDHIFKETNNNKKKTTKYHEIFIFCEQI